MPQPCVAPSSSSPSSTSAMLAAPTRQKLQSLADTWMFTIPKSLVAQSLDYDKIHPDCSYSVIVVEFRRFKLGVQVLDNDDIGTITSRTVKDMIRINPHGGWREIKPVTSFTLLEDKHCFVPLIVCHTRQHFSHSIITPTTTTSNGVANSNGKVEITENAKTTTMTFKSLPAGESYFVNTSAAIESKNEPSTMFPFFTFTDAENVKECDLGSPMLLV